MLGDPHAPSAQPRRNTLVQATERAELSLPLRRLYRLTSVVWAIYAAAMALLIQDAALLDFATPARVILSGLAALVSIGMIVRMIVPGRPEWTRWTLPTIAATSVATFVLLLFASQFAGGFTVARIGLSLLVLTPAGIAYAHYLGEKVVALR